MMFVMYQAPRPTCIDREPDGEVQAAAPVLPGPTGCKTNPTMALALTASEVAVGQRYAGGSKATPS
jgi:hypothetical protein